MAVRRSARFREASRSHSRRAPPPRLAAPARVPHPAMARVKPLAALLLLCAVAPAGAKCRSWAPPPRLASLRAPRPLASRARAPRALLPASRALRASAGECGRRKRACPPPPSRLTRAPLARSVRDGLVWPAVRDRRLLAGRSAARHRHAAPFLPQVRRGSSRPKHVDGACEPGRARLARATGSAARRGGAAAQRACRRSAAFRAARGR